MAHEQKPITAFRTVDNIPYIGEEDEGGVQVAPSLVYRQKDDGTFEPIGTLNPLPVSGTVSVANFPQTQQVTGTVAVSNLAGTVEVSNFPETQAVSGTVEVSNLPQTQAVTGTVSVDNFPAVPAVRPLIRETMDFKGKTAFYTGDVPHVAVLRRSAAFDPPPADPGAWELGSDNYAQIAVQDGTTFYEAAGVSGEYVQVLYAFDVLNALKIAGRIPVSTTEAQLKTLLVKWAVTWVGYGQGVSGGTAKYGAQLRVFTGTSWATVASNTASTPEVTVYEELNFAASYMQDGVVYILANTTYPASDPYPAVLWTDYVSLEVYLRGDVPMAFDPLTYDAANRAVRVVPAGAAVPVTGEVTVDNLPDTQAIVGVVTVDNLPDTQVVSGTVAVSNFPVTQQVAGSVSVANFPETQAVRVTGSYVGYSTDTKPTDAAKGSDFLELDTKNVYIFDGTTWVVI